jgi:hypothetical protein
MFSDIHKVSGQRFYPLGQLLSADEKQIGRGAFLQNFQIAGIF